ncbi:hypothetical protein GYMLUDRAFT_37628 [Collybiopsis luxurians FD-317 M1]|nr:hypothetical protein GYMLUDRAFT_37628 [Collybiopsis luxurians FD-317 M1]
MANEDTVPESYKYSFSPTTSDLSLKDFLAKFRPSMVENDGTKPWIWATKEKRPSFANTNRLAAIEEGSETLKDITDQVESIKNDPSIPTRSNKKTGAKSKKEVREELQATAREKFKEIAQKHNYLCGKWLIFAPAERIDMIWSNLATSLIEGPLAKTPAFSAKVATSPPDANPNHQHVICLYLPDVYDKNTVTEVMKILLRNHGFNLSGVKSDLYTVLGIDSKHPSGIPSTIWKNKDILSDQEIKELKDTFFKELNENKGVTNVQTSSNAEPSASASTPAASSKLKPKKKKDTFASDDEEGADEEQQRKQELSNMKKAAGAAKRANDSDKDDEKDLPKRKSAKRS